MHQDFAAVVNELHPSFERLVSQEPISEGRFLRPLPKRGVYLFSEGDRHLYIGRSNNMRKRFGGHTNPSSKHFTAAFAFKLAREATGFLKATYKPGEGSQAWLMGQPSFQAAFSDAKHRVRRMDFRCVEEIDPVRQCLLEIYGAVVLKTPYNDFDNH